MPIASLRDMPVDQIDRVVGHPAQLHTLRVITDLIAALRACHELRDYYDFQRELFHHVHEADGYRARLSRTIKRLRRGEKLPPNAPELRNGGDPADVAAWRDEDLTFERIGRQLRSVGDALAWRVCGYDRSYIVALSCNARAGPIVNKVGLENELGAVVNAWEERQRFRLLHDLTSCLRIGDLTEFESAQVRHLYEIKRTRSASPAQVTRMTAAIDAVMNGGPLPGTGGIRLVPLRTPFRTHLRALSDALHLADERGIVAIRVPKQPQAVLAASLPTLAASGSPEQAPALFDTARNRAQRKLGLSAGDHELVANSGDTVARSPTLAPYGVYPLEPRHCAGLICDFYAFEVRVPVDALLETAADRGLGAEHHLSEASAPMEQGTGVVTIRAGDRAITLHTQVIVQMLLEMVDVRTLIGALAETLALPEVPSSPLPILTREHATWR